MHLHPTNILKIISRFLIVLATLFGVSACSGQDNLVLHTASGDVNIKVELANTNETRARGLMFVQSLADDKGMLFDFNQTRKVSFWMRNTFIPLDMIFIDENGVIKHIYANARPHDETGISSQFPVRYVLEIAGGRAAAIGLEIGDKISHSSIDN